MTNNILNKLLLTLLIFALIAPTANAGVVKQLVEVDPQEQQIEEEEVQEQQEQYSREAKEQDIVEKAKRILDEQIEPVPVPEPEPVVEKPAKIGKSKYDDCFICKPVGVVTGVAVSPITGLVRGAVNKGTSYAGSVSDKLGGGFFGKLIGYPVGGITGGILGGISGLGNGILTGIVKGYQEPFSGASYTTAEGDYNAYDFIGGNL